MSGRTSQFMSDRMSEFIADIMSEFMSNRMSLFVPDRMSDVMSDRRLLFVSDGRLQCICQKECPDRMSEYVMAGISRSEVILFPVAIFDFVGYFDVWFFVVVIEIVIGAIFL